MATIHLSPFTCCFRIVFGIDSRAFSTTRTPIFAQSPLSEKSTLRTDAGLGQNFTEIWEPLVHTNFKGNSYGPLPLLPYFQGNSYGPMALKVHQKFLQRLVLVHEWLFPAYGHHSLSSQSDWFTNRSNHIHIFTPIARVVATKLLISEDPVMTPNRHLRKQTKLNMADSRAGSRN